ncbi:MAG: DNA polymerase III subunit gamma/tau [Lachnospiraceae bacterium]|nr:DNA polymerase III subunit gamma/tau [Lachnospiraceae bacterium]MDE6698197.1 DNA polymerase III subunit gamma/tau [Lachnospiraceae bacterium]
MSYTALYRKFRPDTFSEVKGQDHIVTTLKNQIKADRIGHAYLFCGTRGTGKTSIAKLFAKAVNCENPVDGSPCGECSVCKTIAKGASMNVIEIDAASNNGVDNIREIRDEVQYSPTEGKYKVYIIDEVHMLSIGAFNALLKTLEEPPSYVIFILATTEAQKIPITILSRCQRYDFKRITVDTIAARLTELAGREDLQVEEKAIRYIAKAADGSMRDSLSLLDQCIAFYMDKTLTYENVLEVLGAVDNDVFSSMLRSIISGASIDCIHMLEEIIIRGRDLTQFVSDFTWYLRNLLLVKTSDNANEIIDMSNERLLALKEEAEMIEIPVIMRYIRILSELLNQMKFATAKRVLVEVALIKMTRPAMEEDMSSVIDRIASLENKIENGITITAAMQSNTTNTTAPDNIPAVKEPLQVAVPEDIQEVVDNWPKIYAKLTGYVKSLIGNAKLATDGTDVLSVVFSDATVYEGARLHEEELKNSISEIIGKEIKVKISLLDSGENFTDHYMEAISKINFNITEE